MKSVTNKIITILLTISVSYIRLIDKSTAKSE